MLATVKSAKEYPDKMRRIKYVDPQTGKSYVFLTNNFELAPKVIADLYKSRWQIELFFKRIKQHLRIKAFYGTSENAVKTQIWTAISVYVLIALVKKRLNLDISLYTFSQILSVSVFEKVDILQLVTNSAGTNPETYTCNQLNLFEVSRPEDFHLQNRVAGPVSRYLLPHNVACRFPALRSSEDGSQNCKSLQLSI